MNETASSPDSGGYALVTGGATRIGAETARRLRQEGWRVVIHYNRSEEPARALAAELGAGLVAQDLAVDHLPDVFSKVEPDFGFCSLLVNNAAIFEYDDANSVNADIFDRAQAVNLRAPVLLARHFRHQLPQGRKGLIINLLDQKAFNLNPDFLSYTISKVGLEAATRLLAIALAPDIRVCGVAPGLSLRSGEQTEEGFEAVHATMPLGRGSTPADVAEAIAFLVRMPAMTGTTVLVDGGQSLIKRSRDVMFSYGLP